MPADPPEPAWIAIGRASQWADSWLSLKYEVEQLRSHIFERLGNLRSNMRGGNTITMEVPKFDGTHFTLVATIQAPFASSEDPENIFGWASKIAWLRGSGYCRELRLTPAGYLEYGQLQNYNWQCVTDDTVNLRDRRMHRVAARKDNRSVSLFVDGRLVESGLITNSVNGDNVLPVCRAARPNTQLDGTPDYDQIWKGELMDVKVFDRALTDNQIKVL